MKRAELLTIAAVALAALALRKATPTASVGYLQDWERSEIERNGRNGYIRLYHNTRAWALNDIINDGEFDTHQHHSEGHGNMLFFTVNPEAWGNECKVSIDVPLADFENRRFRFVNADSVVTEKNVPLNEYNFRIHIIRGLESERIEEILTGNDQRLQDYLHYEFFADIPAIREYFLQKTI